MGVIPVRPSKTLAARIGNWCPGLDFSQFAEKLDPTNSVAEVFQNLNQTSTSPQLDVIVRLPARSKWQAVNSHYHSANLVFLFPFLIPQIHFIQLRRVDSIILVW